MELKINGKKFDRFTGFSLDLKYAAVASTFSLSVVNTDTPQQGDTFSPLQYYPVKVEHEGELLITGTLLNHNFSMLPVKEVVQLQGYSLPGVLEDCPIVGTDSRQHDGLSLKQIAEMILRPFGVKMIIDPAVTAKMNKPFDTTKANDQQAIKAYLSELCNQRHVILSHDERGHLVFTEAKTAAEPILHIENGTFGVVRVEMEVQGQQMHNQITVKRQADPDQGNRETATLTNPLVSAKAFRPDVQRLSSGEEQTAQAAARSRLGEQIGAIKLTVEMAGWKIGGKVVRPNNIITVTAPEMYLNKPTRFFIENVQLTSDAAKETAVLTCYLPEKYNDKQPKNIFHA